MVSPASTRPLAFTSTGVPAVLASVSAAAVEVAVVVLDGAEVTRVLAGLRPFAVAVFATVPPSTSACVIT